MSDSEVSRLELEAQDAKEEAARWKTAHRIACVGITQLNDQKAQLTDALNTACAMVDACLTEMRLRDQTPSTALLVTKLEFDKAMRRVLGRDDERSDGV